VYGVEWLILLGFIGLAVGGGLGFALANRGSAGRKQLESDLHTARDELQQYRQAVVQEFSDTARKFQTLNDAYRDLHEQLARSSSALCGDITGPLLEAPAGHQDVIPADVREQVLSTGAAASTMAAATAAADEAQGAAPAAARRSDPYDDEEIRVPEPPEAAAAAAAPADAGATSGTPAAGAAAGADVPGTGDETAAGPAAADAEAPETPAADATEPQRRDVAAG